MTNTDSKHYISFKFPRSKRREEADILLSAANFFLDELLKRCTIDYSLNIKISLKTGYCHADGSENEGLAWSRMINETRWYYVHLNNNVPFLELLSTLAHELVHVVQFATGRLKNEENWILSYNSCKEIEDMYKDFNFIYPNWKYGMSKEKDSKEIIILSHNVFEKLKKEGVI